MTIVPSNWRESDRHEFVSAIVDRILLSERESGATPLEWLDTYSKHCSLEWPQLWEIAIEVCPEVIDRLFPLDNHLVQNSSF